MWRVYLCVLGYTCVYAVMCVNKPVPVHKSACLCMCVGRVCICWHMCTCAMSMCVLHSANTTFLFYCLNERVKKHLVVITVINAFFHPFDQWKVPWPHPPFPALLDVVCSVRRSPCLCSNGCCTTFFYSTIGPFMRFTSPGCIGVLECVCAE